MQQMHYAWVWKLELQQTVTPYAPVALPTEALLLGDTNTQGCLAQSVTVENNLQYDSATIPVL